MNDDTDLNDEMKILLAIYHRLVSVTIAIKQLMNSIPSMKALEDIEGKLSHLLPHDPLDKYLGKIPQMKMQGDDMTILAGYEAQLQQAKPKPSRRRRKKQAMK